MIARINGFFQNRNLWILGMIFLLTGQFMDEATTYININYLGCYETNHRIRPILDDYAVMFGLEIGYFAIFFLIPYNLSELEARINVICVLSYVGGLPRWIAAVSNICLCLYLLRIL